MNEEMQQIFKLLNIEQIPRERNYWLIRTESGKYFIDFLKNNYVAIGWDKFSNLEDFQQKDEEQLKESIASTYKSEKRPGYIYNQIKRFMFEIKKGDIVLIPSENSSQIAFGIVTFPCFIREQTPIDKNSSYPKCNFQKCINIEWKTILLKEKIDPYLKMLMNTHTTITDIKDYKGYINRILYSNYILDDMIHVTFNVTTKNNINAIELSNFLSLVSKDSIDFFNHITGENLEKNTMDLKLNVQSPGPIEFIGYATGGILIACAINLLIFGAKFDLELLNVVKLHIDTPGLLNSILKFIQEANSNKQNMQKLQNDLENSKQHLKLQPSEKLSDFQISSPENFESSPTLNESHI